MSTPPRSRRLSSEDLDRPLDFWENGPVRQILEMEFELVLEQELTARELSLDALVCDLLHDAVIPEVILFVTQKMHWTHQEERRMALTLVNEKRVRREIVRRLSRQLERFGPLLTRQKEPALPLQVLSCVPRLIRFVVTES